MDAAALGRVGGAEAGPDWNRLRWRACRRGMKELDVLFQRYLDGDWAAAPPDERAAFVRLLDLPDPELAALCLGRATTPDAALAALVAKLTDGRNARVGR
jgi:antitoxin CptB